MTRSGSLTPGMPIEIWSSPGLADLGLGDAERVDAVAEDLH